MTTTSAIAAMAMILATSLAGASQAQEVGEYVTDAYFVDWALDNPVVCYGRDVAANACLSVMIVEGGDAKRLDTTAYAYNAGVKTVMTLNYLVEPEGICFRVPEVSQLNVRQYYTGNTIAEVTANEVPEPQSPQALQEIANTVFATEGLMTGDHVCARYRVLDRNPNEILSLEEEVWVNGAIRESWSGTSVHFFFPDTRLALLSGKY